MCVVESLRTERGELSGECGDGRVDEVSEVFFADYLNILQKDVLFPVLFNTWHY